MNDTEPSAQGNAPGGDAVQGDKIVGGSKISIGGGAGPGAVVAGRDAHVYQAPTPIVPRLHQLRPPADDFTGRQAELDELLAKVQGADAARIIGLRGMGGVGKTALALKLADTLAPHFPDAQFLVDLQGSKPAPLLPGQAMAQIIHAYNPTAPLPENQAELYQLYCSVLHDQRVLVLLDDVKDSEQIETLVPPPKGCLLLVTSRQVFHLPGLHALDLDMLPAEDACALLLKIAPRIDGHAGKIAELCGYLPLALCVSASALAERLNLSPADYIRRLEDVAQRLKLTGVDASLTASYDLLSADVQRLWCMLSVFPVDFDQGAVEAVWQLEADPTNDALYGLLRYSLVDYEQATARYRLPGLARVFAGQRLAEAERAAVQRRHAEHYGGLLRAARDLYMQGGQDILRGLALVDLEWPNTQAGQAWAAANAETDDDAARLCDDYADNWHVLNLRLRPREYVRWLESALAAARRRQNRCAEGRHLLSLGLAHYELGDYQRAIEFYHKAIERAIEIGDRRTEGQALGNLGSAYYSLGDARQAIQFYEQDLAIAREIVDRRGEGQTLGNLGAAYRRLGDARQAIALYEQALAIKREIGDRRGEGASLGNLGNAYAALGDARQAIQFYEQALVIDREIGDRRGEGLDLFNLSLSLDKLGERAQAIARAEAALEIFKQIEAPNAGQVQAQLEAWRTGS